MNKNVIIISSSPRKGGNSDTLCDKFAQGAKDAGNNVEKIFLKDKKINYCTGCGFCNTNDYGGCAQKDDMNEILEKLIVADVIIFATPVYFYTMCSQMKTFIDRFCARYIHISNKEFYYIMTAADGNPHAMDRVIVEFDGLMACIPNPTVKGQLIATGVWQKGDIEQTDYPQVAYDMGKNV